jgi:magnesium and cobalt exporter, CNNM family
VLGSTEIGKIERLFDMEIEDDDFTTIAGLVINESGKVPAGGEVLNIRGLEVEVLEADERRINRLRVKALPQVDTEESDETQKQIPAGKKN